MGPFTDYTQMYNNSKNEENERQLKYLDEIDKSKNIVSDIGIAASSNTINTHLNIRMGVGGKS